MKRFLENRGQAEIPTLFIVLLLFMAMAFSVHFAQAVALADVDLKEAVALAVKAAANQYAAGSNPSILPDAARSAFEGLLAKNLGFDANLEALPDSAWRGGVTYRFIVYNGDGGVEYDRDGGRVRRVDLCGRGFPTDFDLGGGVSVAFPSPGVAAVVKMTPKGIFGRLPSCERWAAARVSGRGAGAAVVLLGKGKK